MPAQVQIFLTDKDKQTLQHAVKSKTSPQRLVVRATIVLLSADNLPNYEIAKRLGVSPLTAGLWRNRYRDEGFSGLLKDRPRGRNQGGKSSKEQEKLRQLIIKKTTTEKPDGETHWSTRTVIPPLIAVL